MSGSTRKEGHSSRFHTGYRFVLGKQLREGTAGKRRENCGLKAFSSAHFGYINTVHDRGQHPDLIRLGPVHVLAGSSPPEVAAADHNSDLHAALYDFGDLGGDLSHRLLIEAVLFIACEGLPAQLQQNSAHNILHSFSFLTGTFSASPVWQNYSIPPCRCAIIFSRYRGQTEAAAERSPAVRPAYRTSAQIWTGLKKKRNFPWPPPGTGLAPHC